MKKAALLRGREPFRRVAQSGKRVEGKLLGCRYLLLKESAGSRSKVRVGFKVSSKTLNAVKRNRVRRLMREAMRLEYDAFTAALRLPPLHSLALIVWFKTGNSANIEKLVLPDVREEMKALCSTILSELGDRS